MVFFPDGEFSKNWLGSLFPEPPMGSHLLHSEGVSAVNIQNVTVAI